MRQKNELVPIYYSKNSKKSSMWFENMVPRRHIGTKLENNGPWI